MSLGRPARLMVLAISPLLVAGCQLMLPGGYFGSGGEVDFPEPSVRANYSSGTATIVITRENVTETVTFDRLATGAQLNSMIGANVTWRNDAGWGLSLLAFDGAAFGGPSSAGGDVTIQRVSGLDFWTTSAWDRCIVDVDELSEAGVTGSATCRGLRWVDGMSGFGAVGGPGEPAYIEGQEPFDAELTFEAH